MRRSRKTSRGRFLAIVLAMAMVLQQAGITSLAEDAAAQAVETVVTESGTETAEGTSAETAAQTVEETSAEASMQTTEETSAQTTGTSASAAADTASGAESGQTDTDASVPSEGETTPDTSSIEETDSEETAGESEETTGTVAAESVTEAESESEMETEEAAEALTEAETATEVEKAAGTAAEALEETEAAETESGSETETEAPKTSFTYSDSRVVITATASEAANLPQDAELKADYIEVGSAAYNEAVSRIESQLGSTLGMDEENTETAYILYDVYFLSGGERIEPEDGTVSVSMVFRQAVDLGMEGELINTEVVHVKDSGTAEVVTDYVNVNANGDVTAIGFTQDSFSVTGAAVVYKTQTGSGTNNNDLITDISGYYYLNSGYTKVELDGSTVVPSSVSTLYIKLNFAFVAGTLTAENPVLVFDVSELCDLGSFVTTESGNVYNSAGDVVGTYSITSEGIITITYDTSAIDVTGNVSGYVDFGFTVYDSVKQSGSEVIYSIGGSTLEFQYDISDLSVIKEGEYSSADNTVTYTITVSSTNGTTEDVTLTDYLPSGVSAITSVTVTKNGASYTVKEDNSSGTTLSLILDEMDAGDTYVITVVGTVTSDYDYTNNGTSYTTLSNTATATSGNASANGYCSLTVERKHISKSGYYDESTGLITWTIVINEAGEDITGYTLTDTLPSNSAKLYYLDSSTGNYVYLKEIDLTSGFVFNDTNTGLTDSGTYTYKIVYTTDPGSPVNNTTVSNTAYLAPPTGGGNTTYGSGEESVTVPGTSTNLPYKIDKTADSTDTDSTTGYPIVDWTVTIDIDTSSAYYTAGTDVVLLAGIEISDSLSSSSMYMTKSQLAALTLTDGTNTYNYTITYVKTSDGTEYTGSDILSQLASDAKIISFTLVTDDDITLTSGTTLTMIYSSLLTATASGTYYNTVYVGSKSKTGGYTYESTKTVTKYAVDESGNVLTDEVNYYEADGILYWMIAIEGGFASGDSITITDVLPEGMTYYAGAFTNGYALYAGDTIQYKYSQYFATVDIVSDGNSPETLTITITADKWAISTTAYLVFAVKIEDWDTTTYSQNSSGAYSRQYTNSISYTDSNSNTSTASASQTVVIPDLYKSGTVTVENNETTITYTLNVNTNENTLGSSGTITLTDVLKITSGTCEIELDNSSITVYDVTNSRTLDSTEYGCSISTDDSGTTTIILTLEDATAYTITYKYVVKATNVQQLTFAVSNSASISADISVQDSEQGQAQSSSAVSNSSGISIHKVAEGHNNVNIKGAVFDLYEYDETSGEFVYVASYTTSSTGKVNIAGASEYYLVYKLVEVYAPDGYDIWEEPLYFYVTSSSATSTTVVGESAVPSGSTLQAYADGSVIQLEDAIAHGGTLDITKVVTGTEEGSGEYTVKITSEAATAQWSDVYGIVDGDVLSTTAIYDSTNTTQIGISFTLKAGQTAILCELTEGIEYTIEETLASGAAYTATYKLNSTATGNSGTDAPTVTFTDETTEYITITNAFETKTGELKITKAVVADTETADKLENAGTTYTITVKADSHTDTTPVDLTSVTAAAVDAQGVTVTAPTPDTSVDGQLSFMIEAGQTVTLTGLPVGSYTVSEADGDYTASYTVDSSSTATATVSTSATPEVTVTNTYPVLAEIQVQKTFDGTWPTGGFTFKLEALDSLAADGTTVIDAADVPMPTDAGSASTLEKSVTDSSAAGFGEITYDTPGTYYYQVSEVIPDEAQSNNNIYEGIEYDAAVYYIKVEVTEDTSAGLRTVTVSYLDASDMSTGETYQTAAYSDSNTVTAASFTNNVLGTLTVQKTVTGAPASSGGYEVTVTSTTGEDLSNAAVDGTKVGSDALSADGKTITLTVTDNATVTLTNLPVATYTVTETIANTSDQTGYTLETTYTVNGVDGNTAALTKDNGYTGEVVITNAYTTETTKISVTKTWADADDQDGIRPESVEVILYQTVDGTTTEYDTATLTKDNSWTAEWSGLPVKDTAGNDISYSVDETKVPAGYEKTVDAGTVTADGTSYIITNTHTPETTSVTVTKTWADDDDASGKRPASITINLLADGAVKDSQTVTAAADGSWTCSFTNLPKYADGTEIVYTITEDAVEGYTTTVDGYNVTNTLDTGSLTVTKTVAGSVIDSTKEFAFTVTLSDTALNGTFGEMTFTDGVATFTLKNGESKTATGLPAGTAYTVTEDSYTEDGYVTTSTGTAGTIVTDETQTAAFTNTITSVKISKVDVTTEEELEGAHIQILDEEGNVVDEWDSTDEAHEVTGLVPGETYTLRETVAPDGYEVTTDTTFTLDENGNIDTENTTTTVSEDGVLLVEDTMTSVKISKVDVTTEEELEGAHIQLYDEDGNLVDEWDSTTEAHEVTGLVTGKTYTLVETVAPDGYDITTSTTFTLNADGTIDTENTTTTISEDGVLLVEDSMTKSETAEISVTKKLELSTGDTLIAPDATFYVGLYTDAARTNLYAMKAITFENASASTVTFTDLEIGRTYYIAECDSTGAALDAGIGAMADGTIFAADFGDGETTATVTVTDGSQTTVTLTNQFYTMPGGFYKEGYLTITKKLLGADGAALTGDAVFYAGIFTDSSCTTLATNVDQNIVTLDLAGGSEVSVTVAVSIASGETVTLYVTETDAEGNPVANDSTFAYTVSVDGAEVSEVSLDETNNTASVTITNQEIEDTSEESSEEEEVETETETESEAVQTGDETPLALYFSLMLMAAAVMLAEAARRRRRDGKEE